MKLQKGVKSAKGALDKTQKSKDDPTYPTIHPSNSEHFAQFLLLGQKILYCKLFYGIKSVSFMKDEHGCRCATLACHHHSSSRFEQSTLCGV